MILAALLAWTFSRVLTDCHGGPETTREYRLLAAMFAIGTTTCTDSQGQAVNCCGTVSAPPVEFLPAFPDPGTGSTVTVPADPVTDPSLLPDCTPAPCLAAWPWGEFALAYVKAGNVPSGGACP